MGSNFPTILVTILAIGMSFLRKYKPFQIWISKQIETSLTKNLSPYRKYKITTPGLHIIKNTSDLRGIGATLFDISEALTQLQEYKVRGRRSNDVMYQRTLELTEEQTRQLDGINYYQKIKSVNTAIDGNYEVIEKIVEQTLKQLVLLNSENDDTSNEEVLKTLCGEFGYMLDVQKRDVTWVGTKNVILNGSSNQGRVSEAVSHLCRDWSQAFECERKPLTQYMKNQLRYDTLSKNTLVLVPGAGVGHLPYFIANEFPTFDVDSIELSTLMYICNEFALHSSKDVKIRPFNLSYSGQVDTEKQCRSIELKLSTIKQPKNLRVLLEDFRKYSPSKVRYENIVVCSEYFIDTAENMFEYFEAIEHLKKYCDHLHWINVGPLKYGTRPLVQFTVEELTKLRELRGWKDVHHCYETSQKQLNGYLTDYESLYQGYYGLVKFHSRFQEDK